MQNVFGAVARSWMGKIILAIIVVTFVISFGYGSFTRNKEVLATVGGREILVPQFNQRYQEQLDSLRQRFPGQADALAQQIGLRQRILDQMIDRQLLLYAADRAGLQVSDEDVRLAISHQPSFQVNGQFDFGTYSAAVRQNGLTPEMFEARMREDLLAQRYQQQLVMGVVVGKTEVEQRYRIESEAVDVDYVYVDPAKFGAAVKADSTAEQAYYDKHKNEFLQPEQFRLRYVILGLSQMQDDTAVRERAAERYYERNLETEFTTPRRVRASHILKRLDANAKPAEVAAKRAELEKVLKQARAGADFATLVKQHSEDKTAGGGGDLGFFRRDEMVPEFAEAAFALKIGQISEIVRSPFGFHIIKATGEQPGIKKSFERVRAQIEQKLKSERTEKRLDIEADRLPARIEKEGLDAVAKSFTAQPVDSGWIDGAAPERGLGQTAELYGKLRGRKLHDAGVLKRNPVQGHVFYQVQEVKAAYTRPFAEVAPLVKAKVADEQRKAAAAAEAKQVISRLKAAEDFAAYAKSRGLKIENAKITAVMQNIPGVGANRGFQRAAFQLTEQAPFGLSVQGEQSHLLRYRKRTLIDPAKAEERKQRIAQELQQDWQNYFLDAELKRLRNDLKVKILIPDLLSAQAGSGA